MINKNWGAKSGVVAEPGRGGMLSLTREEWFLLDMKKHLLSI